MIISSSYSATKIYKFSAMYFVIKHFIFAFFALILTNIFSKQQKNFKNIGQIIWIVNIILLICVILFGKSAKGAKRWISILHFNFQPSEFIKIGIILQSNYYLKQNLYLYFLTYALPISLILMQPDLGTVLLLISIACAQLFIKNDNINFKMIFTSILSISLILVIAYYYFDHVYNRMNLFLFGSNKDIYGLGYQSHKAFLAIISGGIFGKGFGQGEIKDLLPDGHTDYVFAVIIEEFGILGGLFVTTCFVLLGLRTNKLTSKTEYFQLIQFSTILLILGQAWLNIASTIGLIPSKGITLPLISYGGSGVLTQGILFGILLAVSKKPSKIKLKE